VVTHCRKQELMWASIKDSAVEGVPSGLVAVFLSRSSSLVSSNSAGIHVPLYQKLHVHDKQQCNVGWGVSCNLFTCCFPAGALDSRRIQRFKSKKSKDLGGRAGHRGRAPSSKKRNLIFVLS
jgi:hypothetical protein